MKKCSRCGNKKPLEEYFLSKKNVVDTYCKECRKQIEKDKYAGNREEILKKRAAKRKANPHRTWADSTIRTHRGKGFIVKIKIKDLVELAKKSEICALCGNNLIWAYGVKRKKENTPSLDRIKNEGVEKEIEIKDIMIICCKCNTTKGNRTLEDFIEYCRNITRRFDQQKNTGDKTNG